MTPWGMALTAAIKTAMQHSRGREVRIRGVQGTVSVCVCV